MDTNTIDVTQLTDEELQELATWLGNARDRALDRMYEGIDADDHGGFEDPRYVTYAPIYYEADSVYMLIFNERNARNFGCRWQPCAACHHESCGFCPACNPGAIAPNGDAYDDPEMSDVMVLCTCMFSHSNGRR